MLRGVPLGAFKRGFNLLDESDLLDQSAVPLAVFRGSVWRPSGQIVAGLQTYEFHPIGRRRFGLDGPAGTVATARKPSMWSAWWEVEVGSLQYELVPTGRVARDWQLHERGEKVGWVAPYRGSTRQVIADLPAELSPSVTAFVVAIVLTMWRRTPAGGGGDGAV
jgi:hypothetical protein